MTTLLDGYSVYTLNRLRVRFWLHVDEGLSPDECWEWEGATANGQPVYANRNKTTSARSIAYALERENIDASLVVMTTCLTRLCVNPAHLVLVTRRKENLVEDELKIAARNAVLHQVLKGAMPKAAVCRCVHCGEQAADYHHHKGYAPAQYLDVIPVCKRCHRRAEWTVIKERGPVYMV